MAASILDWSSTDVVLVIGAISAAAVAIIHAIHGINDKVDRFHKAVNSKMDQFIAEVRLKEFAMGLAQGREEGIALEKANATERTEQS